MLFGILKLTNNQLKSFRAVMKGGDLMTLGVPTTDNTTWEGLAQQLTSIGQRIHGRIDGKDIEIHYMSHEATDDYPQPGITNVYIVREVKTHD